MTFPFRKKKLLAICMLVKEIENIKFPNKDLTLYYYYPRSDLDLVLFFTSKMLPFNFLFNGLLNFEDLTTLLKQLHTSIKSFISL